jgi:DNA-directed RNA polymerase subunit RPC12/RpoP
MVHKMKLTKAVLIKEGYVECPYCRSRNDDIIDEGFYKCDACHKKFYAVEDKNLDWSAI